MREGSKQSNEVTPRPMAKMEKEGSMQQESLGYFRKKE